jgi:hypothetical protein
VARDGAAAPVRPSSNATRRAPHRGCVRRISHTTASTSAGILVGLVFDRRDASRSPSTPAASYLAFHQYTACRETPYRSATSLTREPPSISSTARCRCSANQSR